MPFKSQAQMRGAFAGALGPEMQAKAPQWAAETSDPKALPMHIRKQQPRRRTALIDKLMKGK